MYGFALRGRWIVLHVLVLGMVSLFAVAGFWQLQRLGERRAHNANVRTAISAEPFNLNENPMEWSRQLSDSVGDEVPVHVRAEGTYDIERQVVLTNRSLNEQAGNHIVTPLVLGRRRAVLIDRGWVPPDTDTKDVSSPDTVEIVGLYLPPEAKRPLAPDDPPIGDLESIKRIVPNRLQKQMPYELLSGFVLLQSQDPPQRDALPRIIPPPDLGDGPHLAYAVQWFLFIPVALTTYVLLLRREARKRRALLSSAHA